MSHIEQADLTVILAAGGGTRMGAPKGLLRLRGRSLLALQVAAYAGFSKRIAVVLGALEAEHRAELGPEILTVVNPRWADSWPVDSLAIALASIETRGPIFALPVDTPPAQPATLRALLEHGAPAVPTSEGRDGHPVLIDAHIAAAVASRPPDGGLRTLLTRARRVPVAQPGLDRDFDRPADWAHFERGGG